MKVLRLVLVAVCALFMCAMCAACSTSPGEKLEEHTGVVALPYSTTHQVSWSGNLSVPTGCATTCGTPAGTSTCICGGQSNACIGGTGWGTKNFTDTSPPNGVVTLVHLDIQQMGCGAGTVSAFLNGTRVGAYQPTATCACNACDPPQTVTSVRFPNGIPGYNYGGVNTLRLEASTGSPCIARVDIRVDGTTARLGVTPNAYTFANTRVDTTSAMQSFTIQNQGTDELTVNAINVSRLFNLASAPRTPFNLAAGQTATVGVTFSPAGPGPASGSLTVISTDPRSPIVVPLSGTGVAPTIAASPNPRDFGSIDIGGNTTGTVTLSNTGNDTLSISRITLDGSNDFTLVAPPTSPRIPAGQSLPLTVRFAPTDHGLRSTDIVIRSDAVNEEDYVVTLNGRGQGPAMEIVTESPLEFGEVNVGTTAPPQKITVRNSGEMPLRVASMTLSHDNFATTATFPMDIAAGARADIPLTFRPTTIGERTANAVLTSNDPLQATAQVTLTGTGTSPTLSVDPPSLPFGEVRVGTEPSEKIITLANTGSGPLVVSRIAIGGPDAARFTLSPVSLPLTLASQDRIELTVAYSTGSVGSNTAQLTIDSNDASSASVVIPLSGTGVSSMISLAPSSVDFGAQLVNRASGARTAEIMNLGTAPLNITALTVGGAQGDAFTLSNAPELPVVVAPNAKLSLSFKFTPTSIGSASGDLTIVNDDPNMPQAVLSLTGTAVSQLLSVTPTSLDFGVTKIGVKPVAKSVTITNTGGDTILLADGLLEGPQAAAFQITRPSSVIEPGKSLSVSVTYLANAAADANATLKIGATDASVPKAQIALKGRAVSQLLVADTSSLDFGSLKVGEKSAAKSVKLTSQAGTPVDIASITSDSDQFVVGGAGAQLPPGGSGSFDVTFQPTKAGDATGNIKVTLKDATSEELAVVVTGHADDVAGGAPPPPKDAGKVDILGGGCGCRLTEPTREDSHHDAALGGLLLAALVIRRSRHQRHRRLQAASARRPR